uniref:Uncharacterized protein n=1 Tax=Glossina brevipalpis TaxID=37001 RepID=A0A1A9W9K6_9MUSC
MTAKERWEKRESGINYFPTEIRDKCIVTALIIAMIATQSNWSCKGAINSIHIPYMNFESKIWERIALEPEKHFLFFVVFVLLFYSEALSTEVYSCISQNNKIEYLHIQFLILLLLSSLFLHKNLRVTVAELIQL